MRLSDLSPGTEFRYIDDVRSYRRGKFLVLNSEGSYLRQSLKVGCVFIYSYTANAVCCHWGELLIAKILKPEETVENTMGSFIGWKFGVPVRVHPKHCGETIKGRIIDELDECFTVITDIYGIRQYNKLGFYYEFIPHEYNSAYPHGPRYPVCSNPKYTPFCNSDDNMNRLDAVGQPLTEIKQSTAILILDDGTEITLSAETTATLKKQLGR